MTRQGLEAPIGDKLPFYVAARALWHMWDPQEGDRWYLTLLGLLCWVSHLLIEWPSTRSFKLVPVLTLSALFLFISISKSHSFPPFTFSGTPERLDTRYGSHV